MEALKRVPGKRYDEKGAPLVPLSDGMKTRDIVGAENGESREQVRRYIRLNNLIPELLEDVDMGKIAFRPAVELSYLDEEEQKDLSYYVDEREATPSLSSRSNEKAESGRGSYRRTDRSDTVRRKAEPKAKNQSSNGAYSKILLT